MYASPVGSPIAPRGTVVPVGSFVVTSTFAEHVASGRAPGTDIGNGRCFDPVYAMEAGPVVLAGPLGLANVVRVKHANGDVSGYAHLDAIEVALGQVVRRGQRIGTLGTTGASACHLHLGLVRGGVEIDAYPLIDQEENTMPGFKAVNYPIGRLTFNGVHALISPLDPKVHYLQKDGAAFDVLAALDLKTPDGKPVDIEGNSPPLNDRDQVYLVDAPAFGIAAYALRQDGTFVSIR